MSTDLLPVEKQHGDIVRGYLHDMRSIGQRIRERRKLLGLRQEELARRVGLAQSGISAIERGDTRVPSAVVLIKMAEVLGVSQMWILTGEEGEVLIPTDEEQRLLTAIRDLPETQRAGVYAILGIDSSDT